jgi:hypothetical protein
MKEDRLKEEKKCGNKINLSIVLYINNDEYLYVTKNYIKCFNRNLKPVSYPQLPVKIIDIIMRDIVLAGVKILQYPFII